MENIYPNLKNNRTKSTYFSFVQTGFGATHVDCLQGLVLLKISLSIMDQWTVFVKSRRFGKRKKSKEGGK